MAIQRLALSKQSGSSYVSNVAEVADASHDIGFAEIAQTLGMNYDATNKVMYIGNKADHGFVLSLSSNNNNLAFKFYREGTVNDCFNVGTNYMYSYLFYEKGSNGVAFGGVSNASNMPDPVLTCLASTGTNSSDNSKKYYSFLSVASSTVLYAINEDSGTSDNITIQSGSTLTNGPVLGKTNELISLTQIINIRDNFIFDNLYVASYFPTTLTSAANVYKINNKEYVMFNRNSTNNIPVFFDPGITLG